MTDHARVLRRWGTGVEWPPLPDYALIEAADHIDALTAERDEARAESAAYRAERDKMRRWAEAAAADENANAAELREVRRWFADARAAVNAGGAIDLDALGAILGGSRE